MVMVGVFRLFAGVVVGGVVASPTEARHPILFLGGMGASTIQVDLNKTSSPHWFCWKHAENYTLWLSYANLAPGGVDCWLDNFKVHWEMQDDNDGADHKVQAAGGGSNDGHHDQEDGLQGQGVSTKSIHLADDKAGIFPKMAGDIADIGTQNTEYGLVKALWTSLVTSVSRIGYGDPHNINNLFYDWRKDPSEWRHDGTFNRIKRKIEQYVDDFNAGKGAILVTLSEGSSFLHAFLALFVDQTWKDRYIKHWVSLSGTFGGTPELVRVSMYPDAVDFYHITQLLPYVSLTQLREVGGSFTSTYFGFPSYMEDGEAVVSVQEQGKSGGELKKYGVKDMGIALRKSGLDMQAELLKLASPYNFDKLAAPNVNMSCWFGQNKDTMANMTFGNGYNTPATAFGYEDGDGVVPRRSLSRCAEWKSSTKYTVVAEGFDGLGHGDTLRAESILSRFNALVTQFQDDDNTRSNDGDHADGETFV